MLKPSVTIVEISHYLGLEKAWDNMQEKYKKSFGKETDEVIS